MLFTILWLAWIAAFGVIEGSALLRRRPDETLSVHVWHWFDVRKHGPWTAGHYLIVVFLIWLLGHLGFGAWA